MAGTRLAIQTTVIVQILFVVWVSVQQGFCRATCKRGNLTKDLPLVPGLLPDHSNAAVVQSQWWEDALCHPMRSIADALLGDSNSERTLPSIGRSGDPDGENGSGNPLSAKFKMMLAVENATQLSQWINVVSKSLHEYDDKTAVSSFASVLSSNPMGLEIVPPLPLDKDKSSAADIWSHYKRHSNRGKLSGGLVVYIPAGLSIEEEEGAVEWKAFDVSSSSGEKSPITMVIPRNNSPKAESPAAGRLQPLLEDWMARSILAQQKQEKSNNDGSTTPGKTRLTREFPIEHFLAVLMPLLFPLIMPFLVAWIKEYKRYKELKSSKKEKTESSTGGENVEVETPTKKKTE